MEGRGASRRIFVQNLIFFVHFNLSNKKYFENVIVLTNFVKAIFII